MEKRLEVHGGETLGSVSRIEYIALHHIGGLLYDEYASTQHLTAQQVNETHKVRPDWIGYGAHLSSLGYYGGYNFYINRDGEVIQFRAIGEETLAQKGYNFNTVSICFAGNFISKGIIPIDTPTTRQKEAYRNLVKRLIAKKYSSENFSENDLIVTYGTTVDLSEQSIHPHYWFQPTKCNCLPESWGRDLLVEPKPPVTPVEQISFCTIQEETIARQQSLIAKLLSLLATLFK